MDQFDLAGDNALDEASLADLGIAKHHDAEFKVFVDLLVHFSLVLIFFYFFPVGVFVESRIR